MAFCDGETLKERLGRGQIAVAEAVRLAAQVARGLARAHQAGAFDSDDDGGAIIDLPDEQLAARSEPFVEQIPGWF